MSDNMAEQTKRKLRLDTDGTPCAVCPKCHKQIYNVVLTDREYTTFAVSPDIYGLLISIPMGRDADLDFTPVITCPECNEVIAKSEDEAEALFYEQEPEQQAAQEKGLSPSQ